MYTYAAFNVCEFGLDDCDVNATCIDRDGGFDCQCITGYSGNGTHCDGKYIFQKFYYHLEWLLLLLVFNMSLKYIPTVCVVGLLQPMLKVYFFYFLDVNECDIGIDSCHMNATCINTVGSYDCKCDRGFSGDGFNCSSKVLDLNSL